MKKKTLLALFSTILATGLQAQSNMLTLKDCLQFALKNNQNVAISRYEEQIGEQKIIEARSRALPQVTANANFTDNFKKQVIVLPGSFVGQPGTDIVQEVGTTYNTSAAADANQAIFDMAAFTGLKAANAGRKYYKVSTAQTEDDVINNVSQLYYQILAAKEQTKVVDTNIAKLEKLVQTTEGQFRNGLARKIDLDRIKVNLTNARTQKTESENRIATAFNNLKVMMGMRIDEQIVISDIPLRDVEDNASSYVPSEDFDVNNRNEIRLLDAQKTLYQLQKKSVQAEYYPRLSAFFNYNYNGISNNFSDLLRSNSAGATWYGVGSFGARLSIPLFDGFSRRSRVAQAGIQIMELEKKREYTVLQLNAGFQNSRVQMVNNINTIRAQKENVLLANNVYNSSQENFNLGLATLTDLLDAQTSFAEARNSYTQALLNYKLAELEIIRSTGNLKSLLK